METRKQELKQKLAELAKRNRFKAIRENLSAAIGFLEENHLPYLIPGKDNEEASACSDWLSGFPARNALSIDWQKINGSRCFQWDDWNDLGVLLADIIKELNEEAAAAVYVMVSWEVQPVLKVSFEVFRRAGIKMVEFDWETWIVCPSSGWCIEITDETICFGFTGHLFQLST